MEAGSSPRGDTVSWFNYINLFIIHQVLSGCYRELWERFVGGKALVLRMLGLYY